MLRVIALPLILFLAEIGNDLFHQCTSIEYLQFSALYIALIVYTKFAITVEQAEILDRLLSASLFATLAVTFWTTALIAYRIYSTSNLIPNRKKTRFYNILDIIMQSSFIYLLALVPCALLPEIPENQSNIYTITTVSNFLNTILSAITVRGSSLRYIDWDAHKF